MPIPTYEAVMLPLLKRAAQFDTLRLSDAVKQLADEYQLTAEERSRLLPSGQQTVFGSRVGWARTHLKKAGLLDLPERGHLKLAPLGREILQANPALIDQKFLLRYPSYQEFTQRSAPNSASNSVVDMTTNQTSQTANIAPELSPEEQREQAYATLRRALAEDVLEQVKSASPEFFERLVVDLLLAMGYGGSQQDAGRAIGRSGDGGIDGVIKEDKLGLDQIYLQAKRWKDTVGRPQIQGFAGALLGQGATKGVFLTTSTYTREAREYAKNLPNKIILIDGQTLAELMIDHNVGVSKTHSYEIKKLDTDYFEQA